MRQINVFEVDEWNELIKSTYQKPYNLQQQEDCYDRGMITLIIPTPINKKSTKYKNIPELVNGEKMEVPLQVWLDRDPKSPLNPSDKELKNSPYFFGKTKEDMDEYKNNIGNIILFWHRNFYPNLQEIANDLHSKGLLTSGEYGININW